MRLIDKDELLTKVDKEWGLWVEVVNVMYAPEVEAIPIQYIKDKIEDYQYIALRSIPKVADAYYGKIKELESLLQQWEVFGKQWERERADVL